MAKTKALHIRVRGRVQGIGYRYFVQDVGSSLQMTGWVRNLPDGNVEVEAQGSPEAMERFLKSIRNNHPYARVNDMEIEQIAGVSGGQSGFVIKF
jgi:acylphosphatase